MCYQDFLTPRSDFSDLLNFPVSDQQAWLPRNGKSEEALVFITIWFLSLIFLFLTLSSREASSEHVTEADVSCPLTANLSHGAVIVKSFLYFLIDPSGRAVAGPSQLNELAATLALTR